MPRRLRLAALFIVLALTVAACGGSKVAVKEVPGGAVDLGVPGGGDQIAPAATASPGATATVTPTATTTGASSSTTTGQTTTSQQSASTTTGSTNAGTQTPSTSTSTGAATATPAPGSPTQQYEDFCAQNPGAC